MHFQAINARIPQTTATPIQTVRAMLLKSKKPLPVPVIAQAIAKMVMRAKTILTILKMVFFKLSHSFVKSRLFYIFSCPSSCPSDKKHPSLSARSIPIYCSFQAHLRRLSPCRFRHCGKGFGKGNLVSLSSSAEVWNPLRNGFQVFVTF